MTQQPEALRLADALEQQFPLGTAQHYLDGEAAAELRRLHEVNAELLEALQVLCEYAETSDECLYGTLSTKFVRNIALPAIAKATGEQP